MGFGPGGLHGLSNHGVRTATVLPEGELLVGGGFIGQLQRYPTTCPAQVAPAGSGCPSSGGANDLVVETLPWIGGTFRARGTGLPALALVSQVYGFSPTSIPLASILPQGVPGCDLLVSPDFVQFSVANAGSVTTAVALPNDPAIVGANFYHQLNLFEVDAALNFVAITASNALALTVGSF